MAEWREVPGFPNYQVSDGGEAWSRPRPRTKGGVLKATPDRGGYLQVTLNRDGRRYTKTVYGLVALAFLGPRPNGMEVRHLNGDNQDNRAANLKYGTSSENHLDTVAHGTHPQASQTHCKHGHEFTPENTYIPPGKPNSRACRTCHRDQMRERYQKRDDNKNDPSNERQGDGLS